jgi:hypothetical protein
MVQIPDLVPKTAPARQRRAALEFWAARIDTPAHRGNNRFDIGARAHDKQSALHETV